MSKSLKTIIDSFEEAIATNQPDVATLKKLTELAKLINENVKLENSNLKKEEKIWLLKKDYFKNSELNSLRDIFPRAKQIFGRRGELSELKRKIKDIETIETNKIKLEITVYFAEGFYTGVYEHLEHLETDLLKLTPIL
jgi:hypothetical protein